MSFPFQRDERRAEAWRKRKTENAIRKQILKEAKIWGEEQAELWFHLYDCALLSINPEARKMFPDLEQVWEAIMRPKWKKAPPASHWHSYVPAITRNTWVMIPLEKRTMIFLLATHYARFQTKKPLQLSLLKGK